MGGTCSSKTNSESEAETTYEGLCAAVEKKLGLHNIEITEFEAVLDEVSYKKKAIDVDILSDVFVRFGVERDEFLAREGPFLGFYGGLVGTVEEDRAFVLSTSLFFCKGKVSEKKNVLWRCLMTTEKDYISYKELLELTMMLIVVPTKIIPEVVRGTEKKTTNKTLQMLIDATEADLREYAKRYFPEVPREKGKMHRHEFDGWLARPEMGDVFSPKRHRKALVEFLNARKATAIAS